MCHVAADAASLQRNLYGADAAPAVQHAWVAVG